MAAKKTPKTAIVPETETMEESLPAMTMAPRKPSIAHTFPADNLSTRMMRLWAMIRPQSGVVFAYGIPGISKSATFHAIADRLGMQYIDLRLSTMDEVDLGVFPVKVDLTIDGTTIHAVEGAVPMWAIIANERPTLIHFEELNRCSQNNRNAALGILNERVIGPTFKFNSNVFMVSSGNELNDFDMDIETMGTALRNRLLSIPFTLSFEEWYEDFAKANVHPLVCQFIKHNKGYFGNTVDQMVSLLGEDENNMSQYPSPRSWTFLSDYVLAYPEAMQRDALLDKEMLSYYVGSNAATKFTVFMLDIFNISVEDILDGKKSPAAVTDSMTMGRLAQEFSDKYKFVDMSTDRQMKWIAFMNILPEEKLAALLQNIFKSAGMEALTKVMPLFADFTNVMEALSDAI